MLIKCPKCGHDNQLGAIFCRNCGDKLNIEQVRPKVADQPKGASLLGIIREIVVLLLLLAIVGVLAAAFIPPDHTAYASSVAEETSQNAAKKKLDQLIMRAENKTGPAKYVFTAAEATFLFNDGFLDKAEGKGGYVVENVAFAIDDHGFVKILLSCKLAGKIPIAIEIKGSPINQPGDTQAQVSFSVSECKIGMLPILFAQNQILDKFVPVLTGGKAGKIISSLASVEIDDERNIVMNIK